MRKKSFGIGIALAMAAFAQSAFATGSVQGPRKSPLGPGMHGRPEPLGLRNVSWSYLPSSQIAQTRNAIRTTGWFGTNSSLQTADSTTDILSLAQGSGSKQGGGTMKGKTLPALVLYDSPGYAGFVSNLYARMLASLISNAQLSSYVMPVEQYTSGKMSAYGQVFYVGGVYDNPLPAAFKADVLSSTKQICWMGYNLWQVAWTPDWTASDPAFTNKFGFTFNYIDGTALPYVTYKGERLDNDPLANGMGRVSVLDTTKATVLASASSADGTVTMPYITRGANLTYVGDDPLQDSSAWLRSDRSLAFEDVIHDILGDGAPTTRYALIRIEDVHPASDPTMLKNCADVLAAERVPFMICVVPQFEDPFGVWDGFPQSISLKNAPQVVNALKYMINKGGTLVMHGYSHQYSNVANPYDGLSGDDYEFYRVQLDANGNAIPTGPLPEDSTTWCTNRMNQAFNAVSAAKLPTPAGWNTPHYLGSPTDYQVFKSKFSFATCRGKVFGIDPQGRLTWVEQENPYPVNDDIGMRRLPETIGYVSTPDLGVVGALPADLIGRAHKMKVVRNGYVGCFFHWFLDPAMLQELVRGIKNEGYTFKTASASLN